jgi:hypothetical protein
MRDDVAPQSPLGILQISEYILSQLGFTVKEGVSSPIVGPLSEHIQANIDEYTVLAEDIPEEIEKVRELYEL